MQYPLCRVSKNKVKRSERAGFDSTTTIQANRGSYMFVVIDDRESVTQGYAAGFDREGEVSIGFSSKDFRDWLECAVGNDVLAIGAFILGDCSDRTSIPKSIRNKSRAPIIALAPISEACWTMMSKASDRVSSHILVQIVMLPPTTC